MKLGILLICGMVLSLLSTACTSHESTPEAVQKRETDAREALGRLYSLTPEAKKLGGRAAGILIFPEITKAGLLVGGQFGTGLLLKHGKVAGYFRSTAASYGLQAGVQTFGYALFFMSDSDLDYLEKSEGWEIGVGPSFTVVDGGMAKSISTTTTREGVYAFFFEQRGLMAGIGIQGTKITRTN